jgi:hypothetical protein
MILLAVFAVLIHRTGSMNRGLRPIPNQKRKRYRLQAVFAFSLLIRGTAHCHREHYNI